MQKNENKRKIKKLVLTFNQESNACKINNDKFM